MTYDRVDDNIIVFGGYFEGDVYSDEIWFYNFPTNRWELVRPSSNSPRARYAACLCLNPVTRILYVYGGRSTNGQ